ncbi:MAG: hypothetical protein GY926_12640 [bacterium]|nr:hypothetical protein [bacterium]MCP4966068.1 hypothetical protein [bacterium]
MESHRTTESARRRGIDVRWIVMMAAIAVLVASCGGSDEPTNGDGSLIGVIPGGETTVAPDATSGGAVESTEPTASPLECIGGEVCRIDVPLTEILLDETPSSIAIEGHHAWLAAPDAMSVVEVDLETGATTQTFGVDEEPADVVVGADSLWVTTYEFSFGPLLRIDPADGTLVAEIGDSGVAPRAVAVLDDAAWAVIDGHGQVARIDVVTNEVSDVLGDTDISGGGTDTAIVGADGIAWAINESDGSVERINANGRTIDAIIGDLGFLAEESGETSSILSDGAKALAVTSEGVWVLADTPAPGGELNVVGGGALFLLDARTGEVTRQIDLVIEPAFGRPGLAVTQDAAWYFGFIDGYPVRVDLATGRQTFARLDNAFAVGVATDGATVWFAVESHFGDDSIVGIEEAAAAVASDALEN